MECELDNMPTVRAMEHRAAAMGCLGKQTVRISYSITKRDKALCNDTVTATITCAGWHSGHVCVRWGLPPSQAWLRKAQSQQLLVQGPNRGIEQDQTEPATSQGCVSWAAVLCRRHISYLSHVVPGLQFQPHLSPRWKAPISLHPFFWCSPPTRSNLHYKSFPFLKHHPHPPVTNRPNCLQQKYPRNQNSRWGK